MSFLEQVASTLDGIVPSGARIDVAVSGGPDSAALLGVLVTLAHTRGWTLRAHHVRHGLRDDSADAEAARQLADRFGVLFVESRVHIDTISGSGPEEKARRARYQALQAAAAEAGVRWLATGHTADDNHETLLLRWVRGAGLDGMSGIPLSRPLNDDISVVRPLLPVARATVHAWVSEQNLPAHRDPTNENPRYLRNRIRKLLPELHGIRAGGPDAMTRTMANLARDAVALDVLVEEFVAAGHITDETAWFFPLSRARQLGPEVMARLVRRASLEVANHLPSAQAIASGMEAALAPPSQGRRPWRDGTVRIGRDGGWVVVRAETAEAPEGWSRQALPGSGALPGGLEYRVATASELVASASRASEQMDGLMVPLPVLPDLALLPAGACPPIAVSGMNGHKQLSEIMRERGVPREWRSLHPVLVSGDKPLVALGEAWSEALVTAEKTPHVLVVSPLPWYFDSLA